jgi:hypothetical protein
MTLCVGLLAWYWFYDAVETLEPWQLDADPDLQKKLAAFSAAAAALIMSVVVTTLPRR